MFDNITINEIKFEADDRFQETLQHFSKQEENEEELVIKINDLYNLLSAIQEGSLK